MNQEGEDWNKELVKNLFSYTKASTILSVPVSSLGMKDRLIWKHTPNGQYSIKSGYKVVKGRVKQEKRNEGSNTKVEDDKKSWGKIWGLGIKRKIQHFL